MEVRCVRPCRNLRGGRPHGKRVGLLPALRPADRAGCVEYVICGGDKEVKKLMGKIAGFAAMFAVTIILSEATSTDPAWYLLALWLWKDLSETMEKENRM